MLTNLHKNGELDRIKAGGEFRYLSTEEPKNRRQREQSAVEQPPGPSTVLSTQAAVFVLIEHIKNPGLRFPQIAATVHQQRHIAVTAESIGRFFEEHGLKKTPEAPTAGP